MIVIHAYDVNLRASKEKEQQLLSASKEEQQRLLQQYQRMGHVQISQLQNENELVQDKCICNISLHRELIYYTCEFTFVQMIH